MPHISTKEWVSFCTFYAKIHPERLVDSDSSDLTMMNGETKHLNCFFSDICCCKVGMWVAGAVTGVLV